MANKRKGLRLKARLRLRRRNKALSGPKRRSKNQFHWLEFIFGLIITGAVIGIQAFELPAFRAVNEAAFDQYQRWKPRKIDPAAPVAVVDIDEASLQALGQWPWPRTEVAELIYRLHELGAISIAFDVVFAEPDRTSPELIVKNWKKFDPSAEAVLSENLRNHDEVMAQAIAQTPTVLGIALSGLSGENRPSQKAGVSYAGSDPREVIEDFPGATNNLPILTEPATGVGNFSLGKERSEVVRRVPLITRVEDVMIPTLALEAIRVGFQAGSYIVKSADGSGEYGGVGIASMRVAMMEVPV
ncbi:MAG: CHASE2 domain-containing protein, partial [Pseudomonadota bacterium]